MLIHDINLGDTNSENLFPTLLKMIENEMGDIIEQKHLTLLLLHLINCSYDGIILSDREGRIFYSNKAVERISGIPVNEIIGKTAFELLDEGIIIKNTRKILGKNPLSIVQKVRTGVEVFITSVPVKDKKGNIVCYVANYREMKELNKLKNIVESNETSKKDDYSSMEKIRNKLMQELDEFVVKSKQMKDLLEILIRVCHFDNEILIQGESGTGKGLIAEIIHKHSYRKNNNFVQINCGAIPENLLESELFGYEKGAFTGAHAKGKRGTLEVANNGTVLLDEIGDLPYNLQVKLLKFIESKEIYRVGGIEPIKLNVRIIAATNKNLEYMIKHGHFREDLYYRLNVIGINVPPLRERKDDIIPLALKFLNEFNQKYNMDQVFSAEVCNVLESYSWPGNVRELKNIVERMMIFSQDKQITLECLPQYILMEGNREEYSFEFLTLEEAKIKLEQEMIEKAIEEHGSIRKAAEALGVTHTTILRKRRANQGSLHH